MKFVVRNVKEDWYMKPYPVGMRYCLTIPDTSETMYFPKLKDVVKYIERRLGQRYGKTQANEQV